MSVLKMVMAVVWQVLTVAGQQADDEECGVDLGGQGRRSWRQS